MTFSSSCFFHSPISLEIGRLKPTIRPQPSAGTNQRFSSCLKSHRTDLFGQTFAGLGVDLSRKWSFIGGSKIIVQPKHARIISYRKDSAVYASWLVTSQIANGAFTLGTVAVLPFYGLMVLAPKSKLTKRSIQSNVPYVVLGFLYAYLLYLSWTPDTVQLIFASKYWLPELPGLLKMFSSEMTLASAWIHLLVVDLFAARQVFHDGLENKIETRHSVSLCLFFCPIGVLIHIITKAVTQSAATSKHDM